MSASYSQPPPPNAGYYYPDGRSQGQYAGYPSQTSLGQAPYGGQGYANQGYSGAPAPYPAQSGPYQDGPPQAYAGMPQSGYGGPISGTPPYGAGAPGYGYDRPHKQSQDHSTGYPRKRFSGQYSNPPYQQGQSQNMRPQPNYPPNRQAIASSPPYQASSPNYPYQATPQYPPPPASAQSGPPAPYLGHGYGYQSTSGPAPSPPTNGYAQGPYSERRPEYSQASQHQRQPAPPPPNSYPAQHQAGYPNQNAYTSPQGQAPYNPQAPYGGPPSYPYQNPTSQPNEYSPMSRPHRQGSGSFSQYQPAGPPQVDLDQYMPPEGEQHSSGHGTGYDYVVPTERASDVDFVFPRGPDGESMGKSEEYFAVMQELDYERFSWDGALHPLPNEPIDPNFSIGKAGIITQHYAIPIRYPLESTMEVDNETRSRRPVLNTPIGYIESKYFDSEGTLCLDLPKADDPLFTIPNARLNEFMSISNARLFLDTPDDEVDDEGDVMSGLENALNGSAPPQADVPPEPQPESEPETAQERKPTLDPETERMLAELGVSVEGVSTGGDMASNPITPVPERVMSATGPPPPPMHEYREYHPEPSPEPRPELRREYSHDYQADYHPEYAGPSRRESPPDRRPGYPPERRPDYPPDYRPEYYESRPSYRDDYTRTPTSVTPPKGSPYPNGRRDSTGTAAGSDFGPPRSPTPLPPPRPAQENPLKRKSTDDLENSGTIRRRKSKVKGADTGSIYGRRD